MFGLRKNVRLSFVVEVCSYCVLASRQGGQGNFINSQTLISFSVSRFILHLSQLHSALIDREYEVRCC